MNLDALLDDEDLAVVMPFGDDGATVTIRYVPQAELLKIARKATKRTWKDHKAVEELDADEANRLLGRAAVAGWSGFPTYHGEPLEYSPEVCDRLINRWGAFSRFVNESCTDYARLVDAQRDDTKKNSASMSGSDSTSRG
jgi:hypothetical protein